MRTHRSLVEGAYAHALAKCVCDASTSDSSDGVSSQLDFRGEMGKKNGRYNKGKGKGEGGGSGKKGTKLICKRVMDQSLSSVSTQLTSLFWPTSLSAVVKVRARSEKSPS